MNQLQLFVATTECLRADLLRSLRRLRLLDRRLQDSTAAMRRILAQVTGGDGRAAEAPAPAAPVVLLPGRKRPRAASEADDHEKAVAARAAAATALTQEYLVHRQRAEHCSRLRVLVARELASNAEDLSQMVAMRIRHFSRSLRQQVT
jgi:hypothetical protein